MARCAALLTAAVLLLSSAPARADPPADLSDAEVSQRIDFIQGRLDLRRPAAARFWYAWHAGYVTITTAQVIAAIATDDRGFRIDRAVGAMTSSLGVLSIGVRPFPPLTAPAALHRIPGETPAERRAKLAEAERLLQKCAESERFARSWVPHTLGAAVSITSGLVLAFGYDRKVSGLVSALFGVAVSELQIFTRPTAAIDDWSQYTRGALGALPAGQRAPSFSIAAGPGGLGLTGAF